MTGYQAALNDDVDIVVKIDGDGQMDPTSSKTSFRRFYWGMPTTPKVIASTISKNFGDAENAFVWQRRPVIHDQTVVWVLGSVRPYQWFHGHPYRCGTPSAVQPNQPPVLFRNRHAVSFEYPESGCHRHPHGREIRRRSQQPQDFESCGRVFVQAYSQLWQACFYNYYLRGMSLASLELPIALVLLVWGSLRCVPLDRFPQYRHSYSGWNRHALRLARDHWGATTSGIYRPRYCIQPPTPLPSDP